MITNCWAFWITVFLTVAWIIFIMWPALENSTFDITYIAATIMILFILWGVIGTNYTIFNANRAFSADIIVRDASILILDKDKIVKIVTDVSTYKELSGKTNILINQTGYVNMYGITNWNGEYILVK